MATSLLDRTLVVRPPRPAAKMRLFCFPWAGGGTGYFGSWGPLFPVVVEVCVIRLPGRELRSDDAIYPDWPSMVRELVQTILPKLKEKPFAFCGHSFGAMIAFEVARYIKENHQLEPIHMCLSGTFAPHGERRKQNAVKFKSLIGSTDEEFIQGMKANGGTPDELLKDDTLMKVFLPAMKQDFGLVAQFWYDGPLPALTCPIQFYDGAQDQAHDIDVWKEVTSGEFKSQLLPGKHFFITDKINEKRVIDFIKAKIRSSMRPRKK